MPFRFHRQKVGLTYSCPTDCDVNPIKEMGDIFTCLHDQYGEMEYTIGVELHGNGKCHYHCWIKFSQTLDLTKSNCFDVNGVHPNIINPGAGWESYCVKDGIFMSNHYEQCPYTAASKCDNVKEAMDILWKKRPADMTKFGQNIETNLRKKMCPTLLPKLYYGPYARGIEGWDPTSYSLLLWGTPGINKTQFARYTMSHMFGDYEYVKGSHESLKKLSLSKPFIHDEVYMCDVEAESSKEITDVENGGTLKCRFTNVDIPAGLPRIFLSNYEHPFLNPKGAVYGRRVHSVNMDVLLDINNHGEN